MSCWVKRLLILFLVLLPTLALADEPEVPVCLDTDRRNAENFRIEFTPSLGDLVGNHLSHSLFAGTNLQINLTPQLALAGDFGYTRASGFIISDQTMLTETAGFVVTKPAAILNGKRVVEADLFTEIGGGMTQVNHGNEGLGYVGGGLKTRFRKIPWFALRVELRNNFFPIPTPTGNRFEYDLNLTVGVTLLLFPGS